MSTKVLLAYPTPFIFADIEVYRVAPQPPFVLQRVEASAYTQNSSGRENLETQGLAWLIIPVSLVPKGEAVSRRNV